MTARCPPSLGGASGQLRSHNLDLEDPRNTEHPFLRAFYGQPANPDQRA
jgi:hypothetical protein